MKPPTRVATLLVLVVGGAVLSGQAPATPPPPQTPNFPPQIPTFAIQIPNFKVQVDYVEVDTLVTDRNGSLVRDLKKEDFQVLEDGKPQTITAFSIVDIPVERYQRPLYTREPIEPDVKTNERPFDGRIYATVIDDLHTNIAQTTRVRAAARMFIEEHLGANDLMAVVHTGGPVDANQDFTNNKRLLLAAVDRTMGRALDPPAISRSNERARTQNMRPSGASVDDPDEAQRADDARRSLETLRDLARWFESVRNRRKTILFFSEGMNYDPANILSRSASTVVDTTRDAIAAAIASNVGIYSVDPRGLTAAASGPVSLRQDMMREQAGARTLAGETGGFAVLESNDLSTAFDRIVQDNSTYYVLAYYPQVDKPGKSRRIEVRVARPGVTVRARKSYVAPKATAGGPGQGNAPGSAVNPVPPALRDVLDGPIPVSGVTLRVFAAPFKGEAPNATVMLGIDVGGRNLRLDAGDRLTLSYTATDAKGNNRAGSTNEVTINLEPEAKARVAATGFRLLERLDLPPGRYQVHVGAEDGGPGNVGSVVYDLEVPDFTRGPLTMSGLAIGSALGSGMPILSIDDQIRAMVQAPPVAARTFANNDELTLFAEVYDNEAKLHQVDITATVTSDDGKEMFKLDEVRESTDLQGKRGGYGYVARIPLGGLAPGSYVLTVSARSRLGESPTVERKSQFTIGEP